MIFIWISYIVQHDLLIIVIFQKMHRYYTVRREFVCYFICYLLFCLFVWLYICLFGLLFWLFVWTCMNACLLCTWNRSFRKILFLLFHNLSLIHKKSYIFFYIIFHLFTPYFTFSTFFILFPLFSTFFSEDLHFLRQRKRKNVTRR